jgi:phage shock protein PspC (stress-responsive transcriptional regulator)
MKKQNDSFEKKINDFGEEIEQLGKKAGKKIKEAGFSPKENKGEKLAPRLYRSGKEKILGGVCGGIAEYLNADPLLIRLIWIAIVFLGGTGILLYIIAWIVIPRNPEHKWKE